MRFFLPAWNEAAFREDRDRKRQYSLAIEPVLSLEVGVESKYAFAERQHAEPSCRLPIMVLTVCV